MPDGLLFIDKQEGVTSRRIDNLIQKKFHQKKVGHLGTLDPFATGLLVVSLGKGGKCLPYLPQEPKTYIASLQLGKKTSTGDKDGEVIEERKVEAITDEAIKKVLGSFLGKSMQMPPMTSAIKIDGKPLYELAHQGVEIERKPREIEVYSIKLLFRLGKQIDFIVSVSSGTYIRTLGEDIAERLGTIGYLSALRRISVGNIDISKAKPIDEIEESDVVDPAPYIELPHLEVDEQTCVKAKNGVKLDIALQGETLLTYQGNAIAVYAPDGEIAISKRGLF